MHVLIIISLFILRLLALVIAPRLLRHQLRDKLWLKWAMILCGVWLAQNLSCFFSLGILIRLYGGRGGEYAFSPVFLQHYIWKQAFGIISTFADIIPFFFVNFVPYFVIGAIIGLAIQKKKASENRQNKTRA